MPERIPILTPQLSDYIHARITTIGEEALKTSPTSAKADGSEKTKEEYLASLKNPIQGSAWLRTEKARAALLGNIRKIRSCARLTSERIIATALHKRLGFLEEKLFKDEMKCRTLSAIRTITFLCARPNGNLYVHGVITRGGGFFFSDITREGTYKKPLEWAHIKDFRH